MSEHLAGGIVAYRQKSTDGQEYRFVATNKSTVTVASELVDEAGFDWEAFVATEIIRQLRDLADETEAALGDRGNL